MNIKTWQVQTLGILVLLLLFSVAIPNFAARIPSTLQTQLNEDYKQQGQHWVSVKVKGRNITLTGNAPNEAQSLKALEIAKKYKPLARINNQLTPRIIQPYTLKMYWDGELLTLNGYVTDKSSYEKLLTTAYQQLDKEKIQNNVKLGAGSPAHWNELINTSLQGLLRLQRGSIDITNTALYFSGQTPYSTQRSEIEQSLTAFKQYQTEIHIVAADEADKICQDKFKQLLKNNNIKFTSGKTTINKASYPLLTQLANTAALCSRSKIIIEGHSDNMGSAEANIQLSQQRAQSVTNWLLQQGLPSKQFKAVGYGSNKPIADNKTPEGRAKNRRIEFTVKKGQ